MRDRSCCQVAPAMSGGGDPSRAASVLRGLLGTGPSRPRIETISHVGYCLVVDHLDGRVA
ncbi:MAG: hypothetical protein ABI706_01715 [Ilumatobacteraceae bacterium]